MPKTITGPEMDGRLTFTPRDPNFEFDPNQIQPVRNVSDFIKPQGGFYLSVDEGWERWCQEAEPSWIKNKQRYEALMDPDAKILVIDSNQAINELPQIGVTSGRIPRPILNFEALAQDYDAIFMDLTESPNGELFKTMNAYDCDQLIVLNPDAIMALEPCEPYQITGPSKWERNLEAMLAEIGDDSWDDEPAIEDDIPFDQTQKIDEAITDNRPTTNSTQYVEFLNDDPETKEFKLLNCGLKGVLYDDGSGYVKDNNGKTVVSFDWATNEACLRNPGIDPDNTYWSYATQSKSIGCSLPEIDNALTKWLQEEERLQRLRQDTLDCIEKQGNPDILELKHDDGTMFEIPNHMMIDILVKPDVNAKFVIQHNNAPHWDPEPDCNIQPVPSSTIEDWRTGRLLMRAQMPPELTVSYVNPTAEDLTKKCLGPYAKVYERVAYTKGEDAAKRLAEIALASPEERQNMIQESIQQQKAANNQFNIA